jgi:hypothetical protein
VAYTSTPHALSRGADSIFWSYGNHYRLHTVLDLHASSFLSLV